MGRFIPAILVGLALAACQNETHPVFTPAPSPSPHLAPTAAILQSKEIPTGLTACPGSGPMDVYLSVLATTNAAVASRASDEWNTLVAEGASSDRAWHAGVFGFAPPPPGQLTPGLTLGTSTGLGASSFTYDRPSVRLACWRHGLYVAMIVAGNQDLNTFRAATGAVDARLN